MNISLIHQIKDQYTSAYYWFICWKYAFIRIQQSS